MFPHGCVHSWAEEQRFAQVPGTDDTSLQKKPRGWARRCFLPSSCLTSLLHRSAFPARLSREGQTHPSVSTAGLTREQVHGAATNLCYIPAELLSDRRGGRGRLQREEIPSYAGSEPSKTSQSLEQTTLERNACSQPLRETKRS